MKRIMFVNVGSICFAIETNVYEMLKNCSDYFEINLNKKEVASYIAANAEMRTAQIFQ
jgi:hypothetical protein